MRRFIVFLIAFIMLSLLAANAQITPNYYWTALEKQPKWVHAVDVAYGKGGLNQAWHRYMIGSNEINKGLYWADPENQDWQPRTSPNEGVNKIISYRNEYENTAYGNIAFCSAYGVQIYRSVNGGNTWPFVPGSSDLHNKQFTTIEINPNAPSAQLYVGCEALTNEASVYKGISTDEGETWDWNPLDGGLTGVTIHDLEIDGNGTLICAATDDGIYRNYHYVWSQVLLSGSNVICVEALDREYSFWAATNEGGSNQQLYFMEVSPGDGPFSIQEIKIGPQQLSFGKIVNDISAIYVYGQGTDRQSVYVGTETGLYLFNADRNIPPNISDYIDFQDPNCPYSTPFRYDTRILTLDYYQETTASRERCILVGTENGVYLLTETSTHDLSEIESITCHEITSGTNNLIATSLALPDNSENPRLFINSNEGIIKYFDGSDWSFSGLSYPIAEPRYVGTDIATDFSGEDDYILASSKDDNGQGAIIHSEDGGTSWSDRTPENGLLINTLEFDPTNSNAYAAGSGENVLLSTDDGRSWTQVQGVSSTEFHDIYSNPSGQSAYLGGHGESGVDVRAYWYSGSQWGAIDDGLSSATDVNQFAQNADDYFAYAATDIGVFKADMSSYPPTWEARTYGIGTPELGSIVADKNNPYAFLASAALNNSTAKIWATGDSGRSWVELPLGDIPTVAHINKLAASQDDNSGFVAGTDLGVFYLGPIFKSGELTDDETWGPGTVIVNGDVTVPDGLTLRINPGTDVKFVYNFDKLASGSDQYKSELIVQGALVAEGDQNNTIVFESSHPDAPGANQWYGIRLESYSTVSFDYCLIEHAYYGITYSADAHLEVDHSHIVYCSAGGIY
ncbi:MAG TPA: hypothetical protein DEO84_07625, partial [candidate division Zixibacteria bacterium]|nr:hypothetical protein [candidate division Zixibacteria bacterium]